MEQHVMLIGVTLDQLLKKFEQIVEAKLLAQSGEAVKEITEKKYLSRAEVAKLLKISLPTLRDWTKNEFLQSYKIGNRVLYRQEEVEQAIHESSCIKNKRRAS